MNDHEKFLEYFVNRTDKRFDKLEQKIDKLWAFRWQLVGGAAAACLIISVGIQILAMFIKL